MMSQAKLGVYNPILAWSLYLKCTMAFVADHVFIPLDRCLVFNTDLDGYYFFCVFAPLLKTCLTIKNFYPHDCRVTCMNMSWCWRLVLLQEMLSL